MVVFVLELQSVSECFAAIQDNDSSECHDRYEQATNRASESDYDDDSVYFCM